MWTVTIRDKGISNEAISVQVEFTQGEESIVRNFSGSTKKELDRRIAQQLDALEERDANAGLVTVGEWVKPAEEKEEKSAEELEREVWLEKWNVYLKAKTGINALTEAGVTPSEEETTAFEALKKWVADNRKVGYEQYL